MLHGVLAAPKGSYARPVQILPPKGTCLLNAFPFFGNIGGPSELCHPEKVEPMFELCWRQGLRKEVALMYFGVYLLQCHFSHWCPFGFILGLGLPKVPPKPEQLFFFLVFEAPVEQLMD